MRNFIAYSIVDLIGDLKENAMTLLRQEVELAKKEMSEKASTYARNGVRLVAGGLVAYAGLIVFLAGVGLIIGFAFERLGLDTALAVFFGLGISGFLAGAAGGIMVLLGAKAISATPPLPEKTIDTIKQISDVKSFQTSKPRRTKQLRSSDELHESAIETAERVHEDKQELAFRLTPRQLKRRTVQNMKDHPLVWSAAALGGAAVATGSVLYGRKLLNHGAGELGIRAIKLLAKWV